jgi:bifunctional DNase/RNase
MAGRMDELVEVEVSRLVLRAKGEQQYVHLRVLDSERSFPIVIGYHEAAEIYRKLRGEAFERPMTHDLIGRILQATEWRLRRVIVNALVDGTFFACLDLANATEPSCLVDCRPSDAIALAVQLRTPVFVAREVLDEVAPQG